MLKSNIEEVLKSVNKEELMVIAECPPKKFILTKYLVKFEDIWRECAKYGTIPASVENLEDLNCLSQSYHQQKGFKYKIGEKRCYFFTSILDSQANGDFVSCVTGKDINDPKMWTYGEPNNYYGNETYVGINLCGIMHKPSFVDLDPYVYALICEYSKNTIRYIDKAKLSKSKQNNKDINQQEMGNLKNQESQSCSQKLNDYKTVFKDVRHQLENILHLLKTEQRKIIK